MDQPLTPAWWKEERKKLFPSLVWVKEWPGCDSIQVTYCPQWWCKTRYHLGAHTNHSDVTVTCSACGTNFSWHLVGLINHYRREMAHHMREAMRFDHLKHLNPNHGLEFALDAAASAENSLIYHANQLHALNPGRTISV